jgi:hypothetical protein
MFIVLDAVRLRAPVPILIARPLSALCFALFDLLAVAPLLRPLQLFL